MLARISAIALNTFREAVRARVLIGLFALALATCVYSILTAHTSLHNETRVVADLGAASMSLYAVLVSIVIAATSLHRELELKTVFPILSRPIRRWEYLLGKYLGALVTVAVFVAVDAAFVLILMALESGQDPGRVGAVVMLLSAVLAVALVRAKLSRVFVLLPWSALAVVGAWVLAASAGDERRLVTASATLTLCEVAVVAAVATLFASFSSPFLTVVFTIGVFLIGRSADTLGHLPVKIFGEVWVSLARGASRVVPNLHVYVPPRPLLLGQVPEVGVWSYVGRGALQAAAYATVLLVVSALVFRRRDFQ
jgi:hypothetical protein